LAHQKSDVKKKEQAAPSITGFKARKSKNERERRRRMLSRKEENFV
jgi:hypothetical protein